jgi:hypothetical protein
LHRSRIRTIVCSDILFANAATRGAQRARLHVTHRQH